MNRIGERRTPELKMLIVDDRKENLIAMQRILQSLECELFVASSGNEALSLTLRHDFALILLDVHMPEMDGFELAEILRSNEETKQIPIIFVTASNKEEQSVFKGYESGAVDYLFKPVNPDILLSKVRVFLELNMRKKELECIQSELERSNESLKEFAQVVSHDLRNPLNVISGLSELLLVRHSAGLNEKGKAYVSQIAETAGRMTALIADLLSYAQVNAKAAVVSEADLDEIVRLVVADLSATLEQCGGEVQVLDKLPVIAADSTQMYQLFQNLIGNGIKYHRPDCAPIVRISLQAPADVPEERSGVSVAIRIEDNGIGMKDDDIPHIFSAFRRLDNARGYEGTGLGLATVQKIVETHRGTLAVSSTLGQGTAFVITLPAEWSQDNAS
ncbi:ATP-binding protein [Paenibacillus chartarius]|uniref:histidine kinase n=1 Tax=Paenibacillus chartarius TaxID=747481 RepID=A0ABV6DLZ4_9BACL